MIFMVELYKHELVPAYKPHSLKWWKTWSENKHLSFNRVKEFLKRIKP